MAPSSERELRAELVRISHLCYERHLLVALDGNLSVRLPGGLVLCTQAGCHKGLLVDDELVVIDLEGKRVRGAGAPTSEMAMHLACYQSRPDVGAVIHAHPPLCIAFTLAGRSLARCVLPEVVLTLGTVPTLAYATTGTELLAARVGEAMLRHDAVMLDRHGAVCAGRSLREAFCRLETMEHMAAIMQAAHTLGAVRELPCDEAVKLRTLGLERYGGPPAAVARARQPGADLPPACLACAGCEHAPSGADTAVAAPVAAAAPRSAARAPAAPTLAPRVLAPPGLDGEVAAAVRRVLG
ncbi:MAG: class II aldolase/adducin family protein, partial [Myxococcales bacterium]|nr:class II aldolase/adducin family protein [Myxococcales bacterium]